VFIDPLAPARESAAFWAWADRCCAARSVVVLETIRFHRRDHELFRRRYQAGDEPPDGIDAVPLAEGDETLYWIGEQRALVPGDSLIVTGGALQLCPDSWLEYLDRRPSRAVFREALAAALRPLDVELVLVSHGEPVLSGGSTALRAALAAA
jgi:hypothetical protein